MGSNFKVHLLSRGSSITGFVLIVRWYCALIIWGDYNLISGVRCSWITYIRLMVIIWQGIFKSGGVRGSPLCCSYFSQGCFHYLSWAHSSFGISRWIHISNDAPSQMDLLYSLCISVTRFQFQLARGSCLRWLISFRFHLGVGYCNWLIHCQGHSAKYSLRSRSP